MRFRTVFIASQSKSLAPLLYDCQAFCSYSQIQSKPKRSSFGIAFDIDGVILRGRDPIGGSSQALRRLYKDSGALRVPFLLLTNGGGIPESRRAIELGELLGVNILPSQVVQGHTPFKNLLNRYENELIIATGKGIPALVMSEYGFKNVVSLEEYASYFKSIDPVSQYKNWTTDQALDRISHSNRLVSRHNVLFDRVKAAFVVSDPVDWGRDIQVLCDILRSGGLPGEVNGNQPSLYFAADDLEYQIQLKFRNHEALISGEAISFFDLPMIEEGDLNQAAFASERLGMGAFRIALESIFNKIHHKSLEYVCYGKPNSFVFKNAESILSQLQHITNTKSGTSQPFKTLYMIGDNPSVDIRGAQQVGHPWFSILTRTGVFKGKYNHTKFPADLVVDTVEEAIDYVLKRECAS